MRRENPNPTHGCAAPGSCGRVVGYADAVSLLSDPRMHAQSLEGLLSPGGVSGPALELIAGSLLSMNGENTGVSGLWLRRPSRPVPSTRCDPSLEKWRTTS
jgi:hypothetical protein